MREHVYTCATRIRMRCPVHIALVSGGVLAAVLAIFTRWRNSHSVSSKAAAALPSDAPTSAAPVVRVPLGELPPLKNDLLLRAARREAIERVPIWIMRQAGRLVFSICKRFWRACCVLSPSAIHQENCSAYVVRCHCRYLPEFMKFKQDTKAGFFTVRAASPSAWLSQTHNALCAKCL